MNATDGRLPIDNHLVERLMKRVTVGKKNWFFVGSLRAGIRNANWMTRLVSAHRHEPDAFEYLHDVIEHLNRGAARTSELTRTSGSSATPSQSAFTAATEPNRPPQR